MNPARGLLLINLGTPDSPAPRDVRRYLAQFLTDPFVIDIAWPLRLALVYGLILRGRPQSSAEAYQKIWTERGSPLLFHSQDLTEKVRAALSSENLQVELGMRYGNPSLDQALEKLRHCEELLVFPLYPQYSTAATESSIVEAKRIWRRLGRTDSFRQIQDFFWDQDFLEAFRLRIQNELKDFNADHLLFSYHGLPERQLRRLDPNRPAHCFGDPHCCARLLPHNRFCYRAQCFATTGALAERLQLKPGEFSTSFQSRLGRSPWIKPYTDLVLPDLRARGVKRLAVACPAFVADCLETLEEISLRLRADFLRLGGEDLRLIPSLNSEDLWVQAVAQMSRRAFAAPKLAPERG